MEILIQPVTTIKECRSIERLQVEIWATDDLEVVPDHALFTLAKENNIVLLALDGNTPIGFAFGFWALTPENQRKYASHMVGVVSAYQNVGVGYQLKLAQREAVLACGVNLMTWTFDPLQGRNARFNLRKLGAVCRTYYPNLYGDMRDGLNQGLPSDRLLAHWWLDGSHVVDCLAGDKKSSEALPEPVLNPANLSAGGLPVPPDTYHPLDDDVCLVEIPAEISVVKTQDPELALVWRLQTREIFQVAFAAGYTAVDVIHRDYRTYYVLQKNWSVE